MPALTDSYTISQPAINSITQEENRCIFKMFLPDYSSTTIIYDLHIGLNARIRDLLNSYGELTDDWDGEGAISPNKSALNNATYLTSILTQGGQRIFHAVPGPNQEIMVDLRSSSTDNSLEIIFYPTRAVFVKFPIHAKPMQGTFDFSILPNLLTWLNSK
jgi:hypothetical protein